MWSVRATYLYNYTSLKCTWILCWHWSHVVIHPGNVLIQIWEKRHNNPSCIQFIRYIHTQVVPLHRPRIWKSHQIKCNPSSRSNSYWFPLLKIHGVFSDVSRMTCVSLEHQLQKQWLVKKERKILNKHLVCRNYPVRIATANICVVKFEKDHKSSSHFQSIYQRSQWITSSWCMNCHISKRNFNRLNTFLIAIPSIDRVYQCSLYRADTL